MKLHANHRTCPSSRRLICRRVLEEGWTLQQAAEAAGCSVRTAAKWVGRYRGGDQELRDRSSRPLHSPMLFPLAVACQAANPRPGLSAVRSALNHARVRARTLLSVVAVLVVSASAGSGRPCRRHCRSPALG